MANLLHIDASPRGEKSHSRRLTQAFVKKWQQVHPNDSVTYRDIVSTRGASGYGFGGPYERMNYQTPYLATIFGFIGITDIAFIDVENKESGGCKFEEAIATAQAQIAQLVGG